MIAAIIATVLNFTPQSHVYDQIKRNNPKLPEWYVLKLTSTIRSVTKKYNIPKRLFTAMLMQESGYKLKAKNCDSGTCTDFGVSQIHISSVRRYKLSVQKLTTDLEYSIEAGAKILHDFQEMYGKKEREYWTRYNSSNQSARNLYAKRVAQWL